MTWKVPEDYTEFGERKGAKLDAALADYKDLVTLRDAIDACATAELCPWLDAHAAELDSRTWVVSALSAEDLERHSRPDRESPMLIFNKRGLSHIRHLNTLLNACNEALPLGGYLGCHSRTSALKHQIILKSHPGLPGKVIYALHYLWHRVVAKTYLTRWFYMAVTGGKNRSYSRVEILGRMCRAGFEIVDERFSHGEFFVLGRKVKEPRPGKAKNYGMFVRLNRVGYKGKRIGIFKLRTMYPYSEYLQPYMLSHEGLESGGKFANDYRINWWGKKFRGKWIDELPMLLNWLKGDVKLVGVRPISSPYLRLYTPEMQQMHVSVKPGLLPPYYYDEKAPEGIEEVQANERRYIEAYRQHPLATDWKYFWGIMKNIIVKRKRSK